MIIFLFLLAELLYFNTLREVYSITLELGGCSIEAEPLCACLCWVCQAKQNSFNMETKKNNRS